jgi:hypothetical protein
LGRITLFGGNVGVLLLSVYALNNALMTITFVTPYDHKLILSPLIN